MKKNNAGFTLIEVLVALAILSIALTSIIKATSQNIKDTVYIQQKNIALWVATDIINEARAGIIKLPDEPDALNETFDMLGQQWPYQANLRSTPNPRIKEIYIDVFSPEKQKILIHLESYLYAQ
jgi:general secretion pathway protein I